MKFDYSALNGKIISEYGSQYAFARSIGLSERSLSLKLNNKVSWKDKEMAKAIDLLGLKEDSIPIYFFNRKVQ
ncbi:MULTISPECIES: DUF739 family protein [Staphylococcus]|uniref:DUF739 family protein n=1 Tax=Staphylococcus TaxID=1279 RepID=UPI0008A530C1|nr:MULTISPECIES: DUF739 family protein [Staphylococcus]MDU7039680.1 DUF739 family protein [Lactococcus lactis]ASJ93607.1 DUF739 domain-containing protein [Staphylococcus epidermidis]KAA9389621.1 DUF739 family protein [Staphylococcus epidermidis]KAB2227669.1 DUF739 family protein [Staphylococcus epidermidis]MBF2136218.1 DUF739 family protein [Staphylococcus epidermidis]